MLPLTSDRTKRLYPDELPYWYKKYENQTLREHYDCSAIMKSLKGTIEILPVAFSLADHEFIWT